MPRLSVLLVAIVLAGCATAPEPAGDTLSPAAVRADLRALYRGLQSGHYDLYARSSEREYDQLYAETLESIRAPMTPLEAHVLLQRFAAFGQVAHATIGFPTASFETFRETGGRAFPLSVHIDAERLYVAANLSGDERILPGQEIISIDGTPAARWLTRLGRNVSADTNYLAAAQIEPAFAQLLWLELGAVDGFDVVLRMADGSETMHRVASRTRTEMRAAAEAAPPGFVLDYTQRVADVTPSGVAYLRPGIFLNLDSENMFDASSFRAFIDGAFENFLAAGAATLLIDLRDNPGGDNSFSDHMIAWFADEPFRFASVFRIRVSAETIASNAARLDTAERDSVSRQLAHAYAGANTGDLIDFPIPVVAPREGVRFEGRVFVLVNRRSFSNSVLTAAIVQDYGFGRVLGEPTADLATTYGAAEHFTLPNTGLSVGFPKALIVRPSGDTRIQGVTPDIAITTPILQHQNDPVLQDALVAIAREMR